MSVDDVIEVTPGPAVGARRRRRVGVGVVIAVLIAVGGVVAWAAGRGGSAADAGGAGGAALSCPASVRYQPSSNFDLTAAVPAPPTASGVDGRLVPARAPVDIVLCEYQTGYESTGVAVATDLPSVLVEPAATPVPTTVPTSEPVPVAADLALSRSAGAEGDDALVSPVVTVLQNATVLGAGYAVACTDSDPDRPPTTRYLVGLGYDDGVVWVASSGDCASTTNGATVSTTDPTAAVAAALDALPSSAVTAAPPGIGTAAPIPPGSVDPAPSGTGEPGNPGTGIEPGDPGSTGPDPTSSTAADPFAACQPPEGSAPGSTDEFVPFQPTGVRVCHADLGPTLPAPTVSEQPATVAADLVEALTALPVLAPDTACPDLAGERWALLFTGAGGASEQVLVDAGGCGTASNGARTVQVDDAFLTRLDALD